MIKAFPKIFTLGQSYILDIFQDDVEVTEKLDGSQFSFGKVNGELHFRSKGKVQFVDNPDKMFQPAINYIISIQDRLPEGYVFNSEILNKPKHNSITYERVPRNGIAVFAMSKFGDGSFVGSYSQLADAACTMDMDVVPCLHYGKISSIEELIVFVRAPSYLGGIREGVVVKNYHKPFLLGGQPIPLMSGKLVSEAFKEVHRGWSKENTGKGKWQTFVDGYKTEARWQKAIQHLAEKGELTNSPKDIGALIKEIHRDIVEEEKQEIMNFLWREFSGEVLRKAIGGFPEWYKQQLAAKSFEGNEEQNDL